MPESKNITPVTEQAMPDSAYINRIATTLASLGIPQRVAEQPGLGLCAEADSLVVAETDENGREHLLLPSAATAWQSLRQAAAADGISLRIISAFRSVDRQAEIIRRKLERGQNLEQILAVSALPGYSEHHSGRAVDIGTPGGAVLEPEFEQTAAFQWLTANAGRFGFTLSYPRDNTAGYLYEPWHWCHQTFLA